MRLCGKALPELSGSELVELGEWSLATTGGSSPVSSSSVLRVGSAADGVYVSQISAECSRSAFLLRESPPVRELFSAEPARRWWPAQARLGGEEHGRNSSGDYAL